MEGQSTGGSFLDFIRNTAENVLETATPFVQNAFNNLARDQFGQPQPANNQFAGAGQVPVQQTQAPPQQSGLLSRFTDRQLLIGGGAVAVTVLVLALRAGK